MRQKIPPTDKVVFIEIGDDTLEQLGAFPFDRSYYAILIKALSEAGAKYIVFDLFFSEPHEHDSQVEDAMLKAGNVYLPFVFELAPGRKENILKAERYRAQTIEDLKIPAKGEGFINIDPDVDGKYRRVPLYINYNGAFYPYISFLMACDYLGIRQKDISIVPGKCVMLGDKLKIPLDEKSNMLINFSEKWNKAYKHYSFVDILQSYMSGFSGQKPRLDLKKFKDKVCIVGLTASGSVDLHPAPLEPLYPAVGLHAELFNSIINKRFIRRAVREMNITILFFLGLLISLVTIKTKPLKGLSILSLSVILFIVAAIFLFDFFGLWIDIFYPVVLMALLYLSLTLYKYVNEWKKRVLIENELDIAKKIQVSFLPKALPVSENMEIAAAMITARQVGGDLYDFVQVSPDELGIMIGDVSGKGVPASLFMAMVTGSFKFFSTKDMRPCDVLKNLNMKLVNESASNLFVTVFYAMFDLKNKRCAYSNGGHPPLLYLPAGGGGKAQFLDVKEGMPLGLMEGSYEGGEVSYGAGDIFVFYTDGITEAMNAKGDMYGEDRLVSVIESNRALAPGNIVENIEKDIRKFEHKASQHDDMTIIVIKMKG